ncbi:MAG: hypothetical protein PHS14_00425 [Elusimicrobia bacterium]|nr:hypothetical protein [Elusimicrobiota bacterium]
MEPKPCRISKGGNVKDSGLGAIVGRAMIPYQCMTHHQEWASTETKPKSCPLVSRHKDVAQRLAAATRDGSRALYAKELAEQEAKLVAAETPISGAGGLTVTNERNNVGTVYLIVRDALTAKPLATVLPARVIAANDLHQTSVEAERQIRLWREGKIDAETALNRIGSVVGPALAKAGR